MAQQCCRLFTFKNYKHKKWCPMLYNIKIRLFTPVLLKSLAELFMLFLADQSETRLNKSKVAIRWMYV